MRSREEMLSVNFKRMEYTSLEESCKQCAETAAWREKGGISREQRLFIFVKLVWHRKQNRANAKAGRKGRGRREERREERERGRRGRNTPVHICQIGTAQKSNQGKGVSLLLSTFHFSHLHTT